jgi:hypothetical protein
MPYVLAAQGARCMVQGKIATAFTWLSEFTVILSKTKNLSLRLSPIIYQKSG